MFYVSALKSYASAVRFVFSAFRRRPAKVQTAHSYTVATVRRSAKAKCEVIIKCAKFVAARRKKARRLSPPNHLRIAVHSAKQEIHAEIGYQHR